MATTRRIAMVAHDNKKVDLLAWAEFNRETLAEHELFATGTTGTLSSRSRTTRTSRPCSGWPRCGTSRSPTTSPPRT